MSTPTLSRDPGYTAKSISDEIDALADDSFMTSFARGLAVIRAFSASGKQQTVAQISRSTGIPRGAVTRCLYTLKQLGYVDTELNNHTLRPRVLSLGHAYLSSALLTTLAEPYLEQVSRILREPCSLAVLEDDDVLWLARSAMPRVMAVSIGAGVRLPAYCTSPGRVLLAQLPDDELGSYLARVTLAARTEHTVTGPAQLRELLSLVRKQGYSLNSEELELGLRSVAVPVSGPTGEVQAAIVVGAQADRVGEAQMLFEFLPVLRRVAQELTNLLP